MDSPRPWKGTTKGVWRIGKVVDGCMRLACGKVHDFEIMGWCWHAEMERINMQRDLLA